MSDRAVVARGIDLTAHQESGSMHRIAACCSLTSLIIMAAACGGDASAASATPLSAHFDPPRSIGTPAAEVERIAGPNWAKTAVVPASRAIHQ
jgi:hypothetical protein